MTRAPAIGVAQVTALGVALVLVLGAGCAGQTPAPRDPSADPRHSLSVRTSSAASLGMFPAAWGLPSAIVDTRTRRAVPLDEALQVILRSRVVYVGESHDNPHHHAVQAALLIKLWAADHQLALGMEMFQRPFQPALDAFHQGQIGEDAMLAQTEWADRWGHDFALYRPLIALANAHRVPIVALNAPQELTRQVAHDGGVDRLPDHLRALVPELDRSSASHRAMVHEAFAHHGMPDRMFEGFYTAQLIWDETMADTVARTLSGPDAPHRMLVLAGTGHVRAGLGIPRRAARRGAKPHVVVVPVLLDEDSPSLEAQLEDPDGDYLWVMSVDPALLPVVGEPIGEDAENAVVSDARSWHR